MCSSDLEDGHTPGGGKTSPSAGLTSNALPEAQSSVAAKSSQTGGPFISYGGTSVMFLLIEMGLVLSVSQVVD